MPVGRRYIDDLSIPNINDSMCQIICNDIYPDELDIISTNICNLNTNFLDLDIIMIDLWANFMIKDVILYLK